MGDSAIQLPPNSTGSKLRTRDRGTAGMDQYVFPTDDRLVTFRGRANTFRTPGRAGTAGAKLIAFFNSSVSGLMLDIEKISVDTMATVIKAVTVIPPIIRVYRIAANATGGSSLTKTAEDVTRYAGGSNAAIIVNGDASADGTLSGTALAATGTAIITQEFAPRLITAAGYEMFDRTTFLDGEQEVIPCPSSSGVVIALDYTTTGANPSTDNWLVSVRFSEYTIP